MEDKNYFSQFACTFISGDKNVLFLVQGRRPSHGKFYDMLSGRKGEGELPAPPVCQVPSAQNSPYAKAA